MNSEKKDNTLILPLALVWLAFIITLFFVSCKEQPTAYRWKEYTVQPGDTLWSIAKESGVVISGEDLSSMSHIIAEKNGIKTTVIYAGQTILIPAE